jgi:hypothetical protein
MNPPAMEPDCEPPAWVGRLGRFATEGISVPLKAIARSRAASISARCLLGWSFVVREVSPHNVPDTLPRAREPSQPQLRHVASGLRFVLARVSPKLPTRWAQAQGTRRGRAWPRNAAEP